MHVKIGEIISICTKYIEQKQILKTIKGHNSVMNLQKNEANNPTVDFVNIKAYIILSQVMSICSKDIEQKHNCDINHGPLLCYK